MSLWTAFNPRWEVALNGGPLTATSALTWTDLTPDVLVPEGVSAVRGQQSGRGATFEPTGSMNLGLLNGAWTVRAGQLVAATPGRWSGNPIYVPIRWRVHYGVNFVSVEDASFEGGTVGTWYGMSGAALANSTAQTVDGTHSLSIAWSGSLKTATLPLTDLTVGQQYTASLPVYVGGATGGSVGLGVYGIGTSATRSSWNNTWGTLTYTFTATAVSHLLQVGVIGSTTRTDYVDAVQVERGTSASAFAGAGAWYDLWRGHVVQWQLDYTPGRETATITAAELPALLSRMPMPPLIAAEQLADGAAGAWPLTDAAGATFAGDVSGSSQNATIASVGDGGTVTFGTGTAPGPEGGTVATFTPTSATAGEYLLGSAWSLATWAGAVSVEAWVRPAAIGTEMTAAQVISAVNTNISVGIDAAGHPFAQTRPWLTAPQRVTSATTVAAGQMVYLVGEVDATSLRIYVDGTWRGSLPAGAFSSFVGQYVAIGSAHNVSGAPYDGYCWHGEVSYAAIYAHALSESPEISCHYGAATLGWAGASNVTDDRFKRICHYVGLPAERYASTAGNSTMCAQPTAGSTPNTLLEQVATAEQGIVMVDPTGRMVFQPRTARYNATPYLTLDARTGLLLSSSGQVKNDADLVNVVKASRPGGSTVRATASAANLAQYGQASLDLTLLVDTDVQVAAIAQWRSLVDSVPSDKFTSFTTSMVTLDGLALAATTLTVDISDVVRVTNLPTASPTSSLDLFVEGIRWDIDGGDLRATLFMSPAAAGTVWVLESATYGQLDSTTILAL